MKVREALALSKAKKSVEAIRALRLNYRWSGVWAWLRAPSCLRCGGYGTTRGDKGRPRLCPACDGHAPPGYQRILSEPEKVIQEQHALAEGAFV